jgi:hypothetical protein
MDKQTHLKEELKQKKLALEVQGENMWGVKQNLKYYEGQKKKLERQL